MKTNITLCYIAIIASLLFLISCVGYIPHLFCWLPFVTSVIVSVCYKPFRQKLQKEMQNMLEMSAEKF